MRDNEPIPPYNHVQFPGMTDTDVSAARDYLPDAPPDVLVELHALLRDSAPAFSDPDEHGEWSVQIARDRMHRFHSGVHAMAEDGSLLGVLQARIAAREAEATRVANPEIALRPSRLWQAMPRRLHRGKPHPA